MIWLAVLGALVLLFVLAMTYLAWYVQWETAQTAGMAYYGRPLAERRSLKQRIHRYSLPIKPVVQLLALANRGRAQMPAFEFDGVYGPTKVSSPAVFERAARYQPRPEDVFVVTQMRCGTTWMQQLVYQVVTRGRGEFGDGARGHLYAISPWIDAVNSVSIEDAPLVGERPTRIIKSHLPTRLCPYSSQARYLYVTRHPVSCFASIVDYNRSLLGPLAPPVTTLADWFCSDRMYWLPWPRHVDGWWEWAASRDNVLFVHFEDMKKNFPAVRERVERFLGYELTAAERSQVDERSSFRYMKEHEEFFEMAPPTMYSAGGGEFLASGRESRKDDVTPVIAEQIATYCRQALAGRNYPVDRFYPDLIPRR
jgi:aryl sulfotransferase